MGKLGIARRKSKLLAVLLAFILPGSGHIYAGQHPRGVLLLAALLLDLTAMIRLADSDGGRHLLFIVYLGMMLPVFYFISVFDTLQSMETEGPEPVPFGLLHGVILSLTGIIMLVMVKPPESLLPWMNELAEWSVGPMIMAAAVLLQIRSRRGSMTMFKLGRFTAALLILTVGGLLLWDQIQGRNDIALLGQWWPMLFIVLGFEIIVFSVRFKGTARKLRLDVTGSLIALIIAGTAYVVTQYADIPYRWLDQFNVDLTGKTEYAEESGFRYDKPIMKIPYEEDVSLIQIINPNGEVTVQAGDVQEIEIMTTVWVDVAEQAEADTIAEQSTVKVNPGKEILLEAKGQSYGAGGIKKTRMNMQITVPAALSYEAYVKKAADAEAEAEAKAKAKAEAEAEAMQADMDSESDTDEAAIPPVANGLESEAADYTQSEGNDAPDQTVGNNDEEQQPLETEDPEKEVKAKLKIEIENGSIEVMRLALPGGLEIRNNSGVVKVGSVVGSLAVKGNNAEIHAENIEGDSSLETKNGTIIAADIQGSLYANTLNGSLDIMQVTDDVEVETKNGKIKIAGAGAAVKANTLNGSIELSSKDVGGNWDLDSSIGEIMLSLPEEGDYSVYGSVTFGNISTELPFEVSKKTVKGALGEGRYRIQINATNSIVIRRYAGAE